MCNVQNYHLESAMVEVGERGTDREGSDSICVSPTAGSVALDQASKWKPRRNDHLGKNPHKPGISMLKQTSH